MIPQSARAKAFFESPAAPTISPASKFKSEAALARQAKTSVNGHPPGDGDYDAYSNFDDDFEDDFDDEDELEVGAAIQVRVGGGSTAWHKGRVKHAHSNGTYDVVYVDGVTRVRHKARGLHRQLIRKDDRRVQRSQRVRERALGSESAAPAVAASTAAETRTPQGRWCSAGTRERQHIFSLNIGFNQSNNANDNYDDGYLTRCKGVMRGIHSYTHV